MRILKPALALFSLLTLAIAQAQPAEVWRSPLTYFTHGNETTFSAVHRIQTDSAGNYYVCGDFDTHDLGLDQAVVAKYSSSGALLWERAYTDPKMLSFTSRTYAVSSAGDVYVAGTDTPLNGGSGNYLIKWDANGNLQWEKSFDPLLYSVDIYPCSSGGIVMVGPTGESWAKLEIVRFASDGTVAWTKFLSGSFDTYFAQDLTSTSGGTIYISCRSNTLGQLLCAFDTNGNALWTKQIANAGLYRLTPDAAGGVYAGGLTSIGLNVSAYCAAHYDSAGNQLWLTATPIQVNGVPSSLAVGQNGAVVLGGAAIGTNGGNSHALTCHFTSAGVNDWNQLYDSPSGGLNSILGVAIDTAGSVYCAASLNSDPILNKPVSGMLKYASDGTPLWLNTLPNQTPGGYIAVHALMLDSAGNPVMISNVVGPPGDGDDFALVSYTPAGAIRFETIEDQPIYTPGQTTDVFAVDLNGNSFTLGTNGTFASAVLLPTMTVNKVASNGTRLWHADFPAAKSFGGMCGDSGGDIYVTGETLTGNQIPVGNLLAKYSPTGALLWSWQSGVPDPNHLISRVTVDSTGCPILVYFLNGGLPRVSKFSPTGTLLWTTSLNSAFAAGDIAIGPGDVVYVIGTNNNGVDIAAEKLNSAGNLVWSYSLVGGTYWGSQATGVKVDSAGNLYLAGRLNTGNNTLAPYAVLLRFDPSGNLVWSRQFSATQYYGVKLAFDNQGGIALGMDTIQGTEVAVAKYDFAGNLLWSESFPAPAQSQYFVNSLRVTPGGEVYEAIKIWWISPWPSGYRQVDLLRYRADGSMPWPTSGPNFDRGAMLIQSGGLGTAGALGLGWDLNGDLYLGGSACYNSSRQDPTVFKIHEAGNAATLLAPAAVPSGSTLNGTVTLAGAAPTGGTIVYLASGNPAITVPPSVTVAAGQTSAVFGAHAINAGYAKIATTVTGSTGARQVSAPTSAVPSDYAAFVTQTVPASMVAGQHYTVSLQFKNTGGIAWNTAHAYKIRSMNPSNNATWGSTRIALATSPVAPGATGTFNATVLAPAIAGTYNFQWQMIQDDIAYPFGPASTNVAVTVVKAADAAQFVSQASVPLTVVHGTTFHPTLVFKNVGSTTWSAGSGYALKSRNPYNNTNWNTSTLALPANVAPGATITLTPTLTAPITPGTYGFQWSMIHGGTLFGDLSANAQITVS